MESKRTVRKRHSWIGNGTEQSCIHCDCIRLFKRLPNGWKEYSYVNKNTGEIMSVYQCSSNQLEMIL